MAEPAAEHDLADAPLQRRRVGRIAPRVLHRHRRTAPQALPCSYFVNGLVQASKAEAVVRSALDVAGQLANFSMLCRKLAINVSLGSSQQQLQRCVSKDLAIQRAAERPNSREATLYTAPWPPRPMHSSRSMSSRARSTFGLGACGLRVQIRRQLTRGEHWQRHQHRE